MSSFLLMYNRRTGELKVTTYTGPRASVDAIEERVRREHSRVDGNIEIVAVNARSLDDVRANHQRYFRGAGEILTAAGR